MSRVQRIGPPAFQRDHSAAAVAHPRGTIAPRPFDPDQPGKNRVLTNTGMSAFRPAVKLPSILPPPFPKEEIPPTEMPPPDDEVKVPAEPSPEEEFERRVQAQVALQMAQHARVTAPPPPLQEYHEPDSKHFQGLAEVGTTPAPKKEPRKKKEVDPDAPPKKLTAWNVFRKDHGQDADVLALPAKERMAKLSELYRAEQAALGIIVPPAKKKTPKAE